MKKYINFLCGFLTAISCLALQSDYLGKEKYIEHLNSPGGWLDPKFSIPLYIILLLIVAKLFYETNFKQKESD